MFLGDDPPIELVALGLLFFAIAVLLLRAPSLPVRISTQATLAPSGEIAAVMGWSHPYTLGVLAGWKMAPVYCRAVLCYDHRVSLDGAPAEVDLPPTDDAPPRPELLTPKEEKAIADEARVDGIYVIRIREAAEQLVGRGA